MKQKKVEEKLFYEPVMVQVLVMKRPISLLHSLSGEMGIDDVEDGEDITLQ